MILVAVLGANGQLGSDILEVLLENDGIEVIPIGRKHIDVSDRNQLKAYLSQLKQVDYVINCIAMTHTGTCEKEKDLAYSINAYPLYEICEFCDRVGATLIHISTDYIFSGNTDRPYIETDEPAPINNYGASKLAAEDIIRSHLDKFFILRTSSLFGVKGASGKGGNFVETMLKKARADEDIAVIDDIYMSPTHTLEVARVIDQIIARENKDYGIYHAACEGACSWYDFTLMIFEKLKIKKDVKAIKQFQLRDELRRPAFSVLNSDKLKTIYKPVRWEEGLSEYLQRKGY